MQRPPDLPDAVALARQEAGRRLAWWRRAAGLSQEQLGDRVGYSRSQVAGTERGSQRAAWDFWRRCDDALGARGALKAAHQDIEAARQAREQAAAQRAEVEREARVQRWRERHGLPQPPAGSPATASAPSDRGALVDAALAAASRPRTTTPQAAPAASSSSSGLAPLPALGGALTDWLDVGTLSEILDAWSHTLDRRRFLRHSAGATGAMVAAWLEWLDPDARARLAGTVRGAYRVDEATVADLTEIAERYQRIYHTIPAEELLAGVLQHLRMVSRFLKTTQPTDLHRGLALAAGETAVVAGWLSFYDLNDRTDALVYYSIAAKAAREAGNHGLATYALGQMSFLPAYAGKAKDALLFVDRAAHEAAYGVSAKTSGWLAATQAEAEAKLGDRPASLRSLDRAERALAAAGDQEHPPWIEYFDQSRLAGHKGACYTWLGEAEQACQALDEALGHLGPSAPKRRSVVLADKAAALIERKELDEGCRVAGQALTILADTPYAAGFQRVRDVWARVQPQRETPAARELEAQILATALGR